jgi:hypothetical protein
MNMSSQIQTTQAKTIQGEGNPFKHRSSEGIIEPHFLGILTACFPNLFLRLLASGMFTSQDSILLADHQKQGSTWGLGWNWSS